MPKINPDKLLQLLITYQEEADTSRKNGWGERDEVWRANIDLYFSRFDFSRKAEWQSKQVMPEGSLYIDRWAAALRSALVVPGVWYSVETHIPELEPAFRKFLGYWLERCGTTALGYPCDFARVFEDQAKLAALMSAAASVTWEGQLDGSGRVRVDTVDPREIWLDPTGRGCYRIRRREMDYYQLMALTALDPKRWDMQMIRKLQAARAVEEETDRMELVGHDVRVTSARRPVVLDEYLATILDDEGNDIFGEKQYCIVANEEYIIRGPEANPFLHGLDWIVFAPAINVPLSVYGRTYVETWGDIARTFVQMTNLIIDAGMLASMNAFALQPDMLENPKQAAEGVYPNKTFLLASGSNAADFIKEIPLGNLSTAAVNVWTALKQEMREGAATNDLDLGQSVPKGDVTATEITAVQSGGSALIQSIAATLEVGCVDPLLNLIFQTALQHFDENDAALHLALGEEYFSMFVARREEFIRLAPAFQARGISGLVERGQKLKAMLQIIQALGSSPLLQQALLQSIGFGAFARQLLVLVGLDPNDFPPEQAPVPVGPPGAGASAPGASPGMAPGGQPAGAPAAPGNGSGGFGA